MFDHINIAGRIVRVTLPLALAALAAVGAALTNGPIALLCAAVCIVSIAAREVDTAQDRLSELHDVLTGHRERDVSQFFTTSARRNHLLVDRQLALLDDLQADVEDPDVLAGYYELDHLATRMRRNTASVLVLARVETHRRRPDPVALADVIRAGISEIEDYRRAHLLAIAHADVVGSVVGDLAHMLAEILDNAAAFSPPDSDVTISGAIVQHGYVITIRDHGIGLTADRLHELNQNLATPPTPGHQSEQSLGLSVVALLAQKHHVRVELHPGGAAGTTVTVLLPADLLATHDPQALPPPTPSQAASPSDALAPPAITPPPLRHVAETDGVRGEALRPAATVPLTQPTIDPLPKLVLTTRSNSEPTASTDGDN